MSFQESFRQSFRVLENVSFYYEIDKPNVQLIMNRLLNDFCNMNISGYNNTNDYFWCKKMKNNVCVLFITIYITSPQFNKSHITVTTILGKKQEADVFIKNLKNALNRYKDNPFLRDYLTIK